MAHEFFRKLKNNVEILQIRKICWKITLENP